MTGRGEQERVIKLRAPLINFLSEKLQSNLRNTSTIAFHHFPSPSIALSKKKNLVSLAADVDVDVDGDDDVDHKISGESLRRVERTRPKTFSSTCLPIGAKRCASRAKFYLGQSLPALQRLT